ncbi:hypothetical protein BB561_005073 [Smittium simulii]|uniref:Uncharacterized protein n=1 Tax=Smittium simulii TaxID=133385 RepID=A0A2T9YCC1_9FUNG|nr:hypothetical protein BB561_005073 [Smittium simulii]
MSSKIKVTRIFQEKLPDLMLEEYKLNLMSIFQQENTSFLFICNSHIYSNLRKLTLSVLLSLSLYLTLNINIATKLEISVFNLDDPFRCPKTPIYKLIMPLNLLNSHDLKLNHKIISDKTNSIINQLLLKEISQGTHLLVAVSENGYIFIWDIAYLTMPPIAIKNSESTWGCDINSFSGLLVFSSNDFTTSSVELYPILYHYYKVLNIEIPVFCNNCNYSDKNLQLTPIYDTATNMGLVFAVPDFKTINVHLHNIPAVTISDNSKYIATSSIDGTCKVSEYSTQNCLLSLKVGNQWGWGVKFLDSVNFDILFTNNCEPSPSYPIFPPMSIVTENITSSNDNFSSGNNLNTNQRPIPALTRSQNLPRLINARSTFYFSNTSMNGASNAQRLVNQNNITQESSGPLSIDPLDSTESNLSNVNSNIIERFFFNNSSDQDVLEFETNRTTHSDENNFGISDSEAQIFSYNTVTEPLSDYSHTNSNIEYDTNISVANSTQFENADFNINNRFELQHSDNQSFENSENRMPSNTNGSTAPNADTLNNSMDDVELELDGSLNAGVSVNGMDTSSIDLNPIITFIGHENTDNNLNLVTTITNSSRVGSALEFTSSIERGLGNLDSSNNIDEYQSFLDSQNNYNTIAHGSPIALEHNNNSLNSSDSEIGYDDIIDYMYNHNRQQMEYSSSELDSTSLQSYQDSRRSSITSVDEYMIERQDDNQPNNLNLDLDTINQSLLLRRISIELLGSNRRNLRNRPAYNERYLQKINANIEPMLILYSSRNNLYLINTENKVSPITFCLEGIISRLKQYMHHESHLHDRLSFIEFLPEVGIALVGSQIGVVAVISFQKLYYMDGQFRYTMELQSHFPDISKNKPNQELRNGYESMSEIPQCSLIVNEYKYLGIEFNDQWNNKAFFKAKKIKTFKSYMGCYSILKRNDIRSKFKVMVIKAIIQAVATYGGELFGMSATQCKPIQQAMVRPRQELSLTDLNIKTAVARTRAFGKWSGLKTWISDLIKCPYKHRCDTWAGTSCNWMGLELVYPELKTHINYVFKIRNGTYWAARRYAKSGFIEKRFIEECPFCRNIAPETIEHILLECSQWQALQANIIAQYINIYRAQLLGEELKLSSIRIRKDPSVTCVKTTLATAKFLNAIAPSSYIMLNIIKIVLISNQFS